MANRPWTVLPHEPLIQHEPNLWSVQGRMPRGPLRRRMCIARLSDGRLVFANAVPLDEAAMKEIESFGEPAFLLAPNGFHRLDLAPFCARYPKLQLLCGAGARTRVSKIAQVAGGWELLPKDAHLTLLQLAGTKADECALVVRNAAGEATLVIPGDAMMNLGRPKGLGGWFFRALGYTGGPQVTPLARLVLASDRAALKKQLLELAQTPGLRRVIPCHGRIVEGEAAAALATAAASL